MLQPTKQPLHTRYVYGFIRDQQPVVSTRLGRKRPWKEVPCSVDQKSDGACSPFGPSRCQRYGPSKRLKSTYYYQLLGLPQIMPKRDSQMKSKLFVSRLHQRSRPTPPISRQSLRRTLQDRFDCSLRSSLIAVGCLLQTWRELQHHISEGFRIHRHGERARAIKI